jgi:ubiquinone/menaquinone biosynthesis C-methylase UbiE
VNAWTLDILRAPRSGEAVRLAGQRLVTEGGCEVGRFEDGVFRFPMHAEDSGISFYRSIGGAHYHERANAPYTMSSLDTPVYHEFLRDVTPSSQDAVIVDIGGGDGRNARPWLERGFRRVVVVDAAAEALIRFRTRVANEAPEWLERLLLIETDARALPLAHGCASTVIAVETLYYLHEDYELGLAEALRILTADGSLLVSERDYEAGILMRSLYEGPRAMLETAASHTVCESGTAWAAACVGTGPRARARSFTEEELIALIEAHGARVVSVAGIPLMPLIAVWMRQRGAISDADELLLPEFVAVLRRLAKTGTLRRCHVVTARRKT